MSDTVDVVNLLQARRNVYSQNGEDGIIEAIFERIGVASRWCCEFGAWDGLHFSNTRVLVQAGWSAVLIEGDRGRYTDLVANNVAHPRVKTFHRMVDANGLEDTLADIGAPRLDLLVIDIDGLDFEVLTGLTIRPRVVCVEVNAGHDPQTQTLLPRDVARGNVGQPLSAFHRLMSQRGNQLTAYSGNAFYVLATEHLPALTPTQAYDDFLEALSPRERRWLYHVNRGDVEPFHHFRNQRLSREALGLPAWYVGPRLRARRLRSAFIRRVRSRQPA